MEQKPWVQAAIDVEDIELAKQIAKMALDAGAEWLEVGTPLLYQYGHSAIGMIRKAVGRNAILVADYKTSLARLCAAQAAREGADYILLTSGYNNWASKDSVDFSKQVGIKPIFMLSVRPDDMGVQAKKLESMGVEFLFTHHYSQSMTDSEQQVKIDNVTGILHSCKNIKLGVTSDNLDEAEDAVRCGADWITFGVVLRKPDPTSCQRWINSIHAAG